MLRFKLQGRWEPEDFVDLMVAVESLYYKALDRRHRYGFPDLFIFEGRATFGSFDDRLDNLNQYLLAEARKTRQDWERIYIARLEYASPGKVDLLGIGEAFKAIEGIIDRLIIFFTERNLRKEKDQQAHIETHIKEMDYEKTKESLRSLQIENAEKLLRMHREYPEEFQKFAVPLVVRDQEKLTKLIAERKLIGVRRIDEQGTPEGKAKM
ncbi:MAG: hypothetical protein ABL962_15720 [Fimbriimonadaceae bacterium]